MKTKNKTEEELKKEVSNYPIECVVDWLNNNKYELGDIPVNKLKELMELVKKSEGCRAQLLGFQQGQAEARKEFLEFLKKLKVDYPNRDEMIHRKIKELERK